MTLQEILTRYQKLVNESKLDPDMPAFMLIGQDCCAARTVQYWAELAYIAGSPEDYVNSARDSASEMGRWPVKRVPGSPVTK